MKMDWRLIKRSFTSSLDEEDRQVLEAWLDESERHRQLYEEMKRFVARRENFSWTWRQRNDLNRISRRELTRLTGDGDDGCG